MIARVSQPTPSLELRGRAVFADRLVAELLATRLIGVLATLEHDGSVHAVPMWFAPTEGELLLATGSRSRKVRNLERDPGPRSFSTIHAQAPRSTARRYAAA
jgi:hypothetical protein